MISYIYFFLCFVGAANAFAFFNQFLALTKDLFSLLFNINEYRQATKLKIHAHASTHTHEITKTFPPISTFYSKWMNEWMNKLRCEKWNTNWFSYMELAFHWQCFSLPILFPPRMPHCSWGCIKWHRGTDKIVELIERKSVYFHAKVSHWIDGTSLKYAE